MSLSLSGRATDKNYDVFIYDNLGTLTLALVQWTNDTTRATEIIRQDGIYVLTGSPQYRYLGTIRTSDTAICSDTEEMRFVWNYYNRIPRNMFLEESTEHAYAETAERKWNNDNDTDLHFVVGVKEDIVIVTCSAQLKVATAGQLGQAFVSGDGDVDWYISHVINTYTNILKIGSATAADLIVLGYNNFYLCESGNTSGAGATYYYGAISVLLPM